MNLIRVSTGKKFKKKPFSRSIKYPKQKIQEIENENPQIGAIFKEFWVKEVRNAFAHSKYKIENGLFIKTDEDFKMPLGDLQRKIDLLTGYWRYLISKIAEEQISAYEKKVIRTKNGVTISFSGETLPSDIE